MPPSLAGEQHIIVTGSDLGTGCTVGRVAGEGTPGQ
jgi:hypothetical protein